MKKRMVVLLCLLLIIIGFKNQAAIGETMIFGHYEQDNDLTNGTELIEWIVLDTDDNTAMLISKYALDCKPYNDEQVDITWETSTLRAWLNNDFLKTAFTDDERMRLTTVTVKAEISQYYHTDPGNDTQDRVFILNINEAQQYLPEQEDRKAEATDYAIAQGATLGISGRYTTWWSRSPARRKDYAAYVGWGGGLYGGGYFTFESAVNEQKNTVRPVIVIRLGDVENTAESD